jgi:cytochrome c biogenesis protein
MLSAMIYHRRIWAKVVPGSKGVTLYMGGTAYKGQIDFDREFRKLTDRIKQVDQHSS